MDHLIESINTATAFMDNSPLSAFIICAGSVLAYHLGGMLGSGVISLWRYHKHKQKV